MEVFTFKNSPVHKSSNLNSKSFNQTKLCPFNCCSCSESFCKCGCLCDCHNHIQKSYSTTYSIMNKYFPKETQSQQKDGDKIDSNMKYDREIKPYMQINKDLIEFKEKMQRDKEYMNNIENYLFGNANNNNDNNNRHQKRLSLLNYYDNINYNANYFKSNSIFKSSQHKYHRTKTLLSNRLENCIFNSSMNISNVSPLNTKNSNSKTNENNMDLIKIRRSSASINNINITNYFDKKKYTVNDNKNYGKDICDISKIKINTGRNYSQGKIKNDKNNNIMYHTLDNKLNNISNIDNLNALKINTLPKKINNYISYPINNKNKNNQMKYLTIEIKDDKVKLKENDIHCSMSNIDNIFDSNNHLTENGEIEKNNLINSKNGIIEYEIQKYNSNLLENDDKKYNPNKNLYCNLGNFDINDNKYSSNNDSNKILINNIGIINNYESIKKKYKNNNYETFSNNTLKKSENNRSNTSQLYGNKLKNVKIFSDFKINNFSVYIPNDNKNTNLIKNLKNKIKELETKLKNSQKRLNELLLNKNNNFKLLKIKKNFSINYLPQSKNKNKSNLTNINDNYKNRIIKKLKNEELVIKLPSNVILRKCSPRTRFDKNDNFVNNTDINIKNDCTYDDYSKDNSNISNNTRNNSYNKANVYSKKLTTTGILNNKRIILNKKENYNKKNFFNKFNIQTDLAISSDCNTYPNEIKLNEKTIYALYPTSGGVEILSFDIENSKFSLGEFADFGNFEEEYQKSEKFRGISLVNEGYFYIVTGKNYDKFFVFNPYKKSMNKLCSLNYNHSNGNLIYYDQRIFCLSGDNNKKVEVYTEIKNEWIEIPEMLIERSNFSTCITKDQYLFALFGYNSSSGEYLNTIEYIDLLCEEANWKYLSYENKNKISLNLIGSLDMNYDNKKIIIFGGYDGENRKGVDCFYQLNFGKNFEEEGNNIIIAKKDNINNKNNSGSANKCFFFCNGYSKFYGDNNYLIYTCLDRDFNSHVIKVSTLEHEIYYFE